MLKGSRTIKIMKGGEERRGLTQVTSIKVFVFSLAYNKQTKVIDIIWQQLIYFTF